MRAFTYARAGDEQGAVAAVAADAEAAFVAGGTTLIDLMKIDVMTPSRLVDVNGLGLAKIEAMAGGGVRIGGLARNSDVAANDAIRKGYPVLAEALLSGASPQLRNMATVGGNLLQRTRCSYFRDTADPCNKRRPGSGCSAIGGYARMHAILGGSDACIAVNPSDMCVALVALDAVVHTRGPRGERHIAIADFHLLPGDHPERETMLDHGELITAVTLPATAFAARSHYLKVRDRASFAFALVSAAVALAVEGGVIREARVALGGVATKPWRAAPAEKELIGKVPGEAAYKAAAAAAVEGAKPQKDNAFKVELARRTVVRALAELGGGT
jgi:xanthine dehydrogenase YagS FAD-binding subunit